MNKFNTVIFDFDGTFADSGKSVKRCVKYALNKYNIPVGDENKLNYFIGPPLYVGFRDMYGANGEECDKLVSAYRERYAKIGVYESELYEGVVDLIKELKKNGMKVGIASSKPKIFLDKSLVYLKTENLFETVVGPELENDDADKTVLINTALENLGIIDKSKCVMVGDRHYDINSAKKVGIYSVGVLYGFSVGNELKDVGADFLAHNVTDLYKILLDNEENEEKNKTKQKNS